MEQIDKRGDVKHLLTPNTKHEMSDMALLDKGKARNIRIPHDMEDGLVDVVIGPARGESGEDGAQQVQVGCEPGTLSREMLLAKHEADDVDAVGGRLVEAHDLSESEPALHRLAVALRTVKCPDPG